MHYGKNNWSVFKMKKFFLVSFFFLCLLTIILAKEPIPKIRIVSLAPSITEIIYALKAEDYLVGVTNDCNYPSIASKKAKIGPFLHPNIEQIILLKPTKVIGMGNPLSPGTLKLKELNINTTIYKSPQNLAEIYQIILEVGVACNKKQNALDLVEKLKLDLRNGKSSKINQTCLVLIWANPYIAVSQNTFINEILKLADLKNVINSQQMYPIISKEAIIKFNPQIIIVTEPQIKKVLKTEIAFKNLQAVKKQQIIADINPDILLRPSPRFLDAVKYLKCLPRKK